MFHPDLVRRRLDGGRHADAYNLLSTYDPFVGRVDARRRRVRPRSLSRGGCRRGCRRRADRTLGSKPRRGYVAGGGQLVDQRRQILLPVLQRFVTYGIESNHLLTAACVPRSWDHLSVPGIARYSVNRRLVLMRFRCRAVSRRGRLSSASETSAPLRWCRHGAIYENGQEFRAREYVVPLRWSPVYFVPHQCRLQQYLENCLFPRSVKSGKKIQCSVSTINPCLIRRNYF